MACRPADRHPCVLLCHGRRYSPIGLVEPPQVVRLSDNARLVSTPCWQAAYNTGIGYRVVEANVSSRAVLVTDSGTDFTVGRLDAGHKGRGVGDCWYQAAWI